MGEERDALAIHEFLILLPPLSYTGVTGVYQVYCKMFHKTLKLYLDWNDRWS